jgi:hypothetical protein
LNIAGLASGCWSEFILMFFSACHPSTSFDPDAQGQVSRSE